MITFQPLSSFPTGILYQLLCDSYAGLLKARPEYAAQYKADWQRSDREAFDNPETVGRCVLISTIDNQAIGFVSWDPRGIPPYGVIGHHCVLPAWQGQGFGRLQLEKAIAKLRAAGAQSIRVTTENHPFYQPAQRLYSSAGFQETSRKRSDMFGGIELIRYELFTPGYP